MNHGFILLQGGSVSGQAFHLKNLLSIVKFQLEVLETANLQLKRCPFID